MKGKAEVISALNELLAEYHAWFVDSMTYSAVCEKNGDKEVEEYFETSVKEILESIKKVLNRTVFLDGLSQFQNINEVPAVETLDEMLLSIKQHSMIVVSLCTTGIDVSTEAKDYGTRHLFEKLLIKSDEQLALIEAKLIQLLR